ncbi:MAG TPA: hypothetical protein VKA13_07960 [Gammaproteobacteria bacterium]|nr:hypothetical protein [Gammaproteobacteria bacterium]
MAAFPRMDFLLELLRQPTAPYREAHVVAVVSDALARAGVPFFADPVGNLVIGVEDRRAYGELVNGAGVDPVRLFIAHMDHPGFHGMHWTRASRLRIRWHGGSPTRHLAGAPVWLADASGEVAAGALTNVKLGTARRAMDSAEVRFTAADLARVRRLSARSLYGGLAFRAPVWRAGKRLYTKAADDLVGVFCICATAMELYGKRRPGPRPPFIGLLTRAEEVGFIGAIGHLELGWLSRARRPVVCVSLEASRTLPGAAVGKGPVVRLGDRRTVFDADALQVLSEVAARLLPGGHQRRVMEGGVCEATAATVYGLPSIGLCVPLGNYHNEGFEGGPDCRRPRGPAPEFVHLDDIHGQWRLCRGLMKAGLPWGAPWRSQRRELRRRLRDARPLLEPAAPARRSKR